MNTKGLNVTLFQVSRLFYNYYPQIGNVIYATASHKLLQEQIYATPSHEFVTGANDILSKLSFSHIREIMTQDDPLARFFYETECIKGTWSVKELRRQIATNLYFRSGVSKDPKKLLASIEPEKDTAALTIRQLTGVHLWPSMPKMQNLAESATDGCARFAALPRKELFATSKQLISHHVANILKEKELNKISVVKTIFNYCCRCIELSLCLHPASLVENKISSSHAIFQKKVVSLPPIITEGL